MPAMKRPRACDACHTIKIKCELGSDGGDPPCARCVRLGKDCIVTPPKRQKDRVAELEAQVAALTKLLESQNIDSPEKTPVSTPGAPSKKRRLKDSTVDSRQDENGEESANEIYPMDRVLTVETQKVILDNYMHKVLPEFALVPLPDTTNYETIRREKPLLLQAILYGCGHGMISVEEEDAVERIAMSTFAPATIMKGEKSLVTVQAVQTFVQWFRFPKFHTNIATHHLVHLSATIAKDIGIAGPDGTSHIPSLKTAQSESADAWRTWLVSYLLNASFSTILRMNNTLRWGQNEETALLMLEYWPHGHASDRLIAQYVRAERVCEKIAAFVNFWDPTAFIDLATPAGQFTVNSCWSFVTDWKTQILPHLHCPVLKFWEHSAMLYAHECVLYSPTNRESFKAPFAAERLSVTDFPAPVVSQQHKISLSTLKEHCHALLDLFFGMELPTLMALPPMLFASRAIYTQWILMKLYIATTAFGNTYGEFMDPKSVKVDECLQQMISVHEKVCQIDPQCITAKLVGIASRTREWLENYRATHLAGILTPSTSATSGTFVVDSGYTTDWNSFDLGDGMFDYGLNGLLGNSGPDFHADNGRI